MNVRGLAVLGGVLALGGWLVSGAGVWRDLPVSPPPGQGEDPPPRIATEAAGIHAGVARLQARPGNVPSLTPSARNPFRFHERQPAPEPHGAPDESVPVPNAAPPAAPDFRLVGMAEDPGPDGPRRTAVVSALGELFFLKAGDQFGGHFTVLAVGADSIQIEDAASGTIVTLAMR